MIDLFKYHSLFICHSYNFYSWTTTDNLDYFFSSYTPLSGQAFLLLEFMLPYFNKLFWRIRILICILIYHLVPVVSVYLIQALFLHLSYYQSLNSYCYSRYAHYNLFIFVCHKFIQKDFLRTFQIFQLQMIKLLLKNDRHISHSSQHV